MSAVALSHTLENWESTAPPGMPRYEKSFMRTLRADADASLKVLMSFIQFLSDKIPPEM